MRVSAIVNHRNKGIVLALLFAVYGFVMNVLLSSGSTLTISRRFERLHRGFTTTRAPFSRLFPLVLASGNKRFTGVRSVRYGTTNAERARLFFYSTVGSYRGPHIRGGRALLQSVYPGKADFSRVARSRLGVVFSRVGDATEGRCGNGAPCRLFYLCRKGRVTSLLRVHRIPTSGIVRDGELLGLLGVANWGTVERSISLPLRPIRNL